MAQTVKCLPATRKTQVRSLDQEDILEKEMITHSSTLALKILWTEELGAGYCPWGRKELGMTEQLHVLSLSRHSARASDQGEREIGRKKAAVPFMSPELTYCQFCSILLVLHTSPDTMWKGTT